MNFAPSILAALGAALSFALAAVLQQESTQSVPSDDSLSLTLLVDLAHRRRWLMGIGLLIAGYGLQALALSYGPVALVQPIVVTELAFAIPLGIWRGHCHVGRRETLGIAAVLAGLAIFLLVATPTNPRYSPGATAWLVSLLAIAGGAGLLVLIGSRAQGPHRAMLLGAAAGICFGALAVLTKVTTEALSSNLGHAFLTWKPYVTVAAGILALVISQSAYQAGPLAYSMPFISIIEPTVAVVMGDALLGETVRLTPGQLVLEAFAADVAVGAIVALTTSSTVLTIYKQGSNPAREQGSDDRSKRPPSQPETDTSMPKVMPPGRKKLQEMQ
ncbi:MAG: integral rane protein [Acidimicrobiaceae bacterium]|nr:integral rane protein [Acidimicrobiaceae bacterium]